METRRDLTESGDFYSGTEAAWARYQKAWEDGDHATVMAMETGEFDDFQYDP